MLGRVTKNRGYPNCGPPPREAPFAFFSPITIACLLYNILRILKAVKMTFSVGDFFLALKIGCVYPLEPPH